MTTSTDAKTLFHRPAARFLDVGHSKLPYRVVGTGPDLLFIHGWPVSGATYRGVIPHLARDFRCHVIDLPGAGESQFDRNSPIRMSAHVDTVLAAVGQMNLGDYGIVAHDSGGLIGRYVAARDPRVRALAMGNTEIPGHHPVFVDVISKAARMPGFDSVMRLLMKSRTYRRSGMGFKGCFRDLDLIEGEFHDYFVKPVLESRHAMWGTMELARTIEEHLVHELSEVHAKLDIPVQLIWGDRDPFFPLEKLPPMMEELPQASLHVIKGGRLFVHEEYPEVFAREARKALDSLISRGVRATA